MKKILILLSVSLLMSFSSKKENAYASGEWFKFRIHYGIINAGYATLELKETTLSGKKMYHAVGKGWTTGMSRFFFKVDDTYESYFDKGTGVPVQFVRKIYEGGYERHQLGYFNQSAKSVLVKDVLRKRENTYVIPSPSYDVVSMFYHLRNHPDIDNLKVNESLTMDMFFDDETIKFKLKFVGREDISTKFGTVPTMVFKPLVQSGRVFKEQESLTVWISEDDNKIPVRIKANLAVGSLKADLDGYRGLKHSFKVKPKR